GVISLIIFITRQLKVKEPLLEFRVFIHGTFSLPTPLRMLVFAAIVGAHLMFPLYMKNIMSFTALEFAIVLLPAAIIIGLYIPITGYLFDKFGGKSLARSGLLLLSLTTFAFTSLDEHTTFTYLASMNGIRMISIAMVMMPMTTLALN